MDETRHTQGSGSEALGEKLAQAIAGSQLSSYFDRGDLLYVTRTSEAYDALDRTDGRRALVWVLRHAIPPGSEAAQRFLSRLQRVTHSGLPIVPVKLFGIDGRGAAFLVQEYIRLRSPFEQMIPAKSAERLFIEMLQIVAPLHHQGIYLGDLSLDSFQLDERGRLCLTAMLGTFDALAAQAAIQPPPETLHFLAPEQRGGTGTELASDVFALGVLGYRLFTGRFLISDSKDLHPAVGPEDLTAIAPPPSVVRPDVPHWLDDVIGCALDPSGGDRYRDAAHMLDVVIRALNEGSPPGGANRWARRAVIPSNTGKGQVRSSQQQEEEPRANGELTSKPASSSVDRRRESPSELSTEVRRGGLTEARGRKRGGVPQLSVTWVATAFVAVVSAIMLFVLFDKMNAAPPREEDPVRKHSELAPADLKPLIYDVTAPEIPLEKRQQLLQKIAEHDDPIAYAVLMSMLKSNSDGRLKGAAQQYLVERIKRQGRAKSAEIVGKWFMAQSESQKNPADSPLYPLLLRACDPSKPLESRRQAITDAYKLDSVVALQLSAALSLDEPEKNFVPVLRKFLSVEQPDVDFSDRGIGALLLSSNALSVFFDHRMLETIQKFSDEDLKWVMLQISKFDNMLLFDVAREVLRRKAVPPYQSVFLKTLVEAGRFSNSGPIQRALVRSSLGKLGQDEITQFGKWMSLDAEPVLLAACALVTEPELEVTAFDTLAGRTLQTEPAASLMAWIKSKYWQYRKRFVKTIGVLGLVDLASDEDIKFAFEPLMPFAGNPALFHVLIDTKHPRIIKIALDRFGEVMPSAELLPLLSHKNKYIRVEAIRALKGRNELVVLQTILREFNREQDPDVKKIYRETHWVTNDREKAPAPPGMPAVPPAPPAARTN